MRTRIVSTHAFALPRSASARFTRAVSRRPPKYRRRRAFTLIEVLLSIFILGIGVISIAALFPAGIAQQRQSVDEVIGPIVAKNALTVLRGKLRPDFFGTFEGLAPFGWPNNPRPTVPGDWPWRRPGVFAEDTNLNSLGGGQVMVPAGSIGVFSMVDTNGYNGSDTEVPWTSAWGATPHQLIITQRERYYPMATAYTNNPDDVAPQYVWDCMFRRYQGKIQVAIFVYRVSMSGGGGVPYTLSVNPGGGGGGGGGPTGPGGPGPGGGSGPTTLPVWLEFPADDMWHAGSGWLVPGNPAYKPIKAFDTGNYNSDDQAQAWMEPKQWLLDNTGNIHRVAGQYRQNDDPNNPLFIELVRPVPKTPNIPANYGGQFVNTHYRDAFLVRDIWYIPTRDINGRQLTPVYATVKEL